MLQAKPQTDNGPDSVPRDLSQFFSPACRAPALGFLESAREMRDVYKAAPFPDFADPWRERILSLLMLVDGPLIPSKPK